MQHLAIIMDGNRRWAALQKQAVHLGMEPADASHTLRALLASIDTCLRHGIPYLSVYALSIENLQRQDDSVPLIYAMLKLKSGEITANLCERGVRLQFTGDRDLFDDSVAAEISTIEHGTAACTTMLVTVLFCYGAQQEIVAAARSVAQQVQAGTLAPMEVTPARLAQELWTGGLPPVDLLVRTGGFRRLSNFLFYTAAYAEFAFLDILWPELTVEILEGLVLKFTKTERKFGR